MVEIDGESFRQVYKDPVGSKKKSKSGFLSLHKEGDVFTTVADSNGSIVDGDILVEKYTVENGQPVVVEETIYEIRERANS